MIFYKIHRPKDDIIVALIPHKEDKKYSFVNISKNHICPCKFNTIKEAEDDLNKYIELGKIMKYEQLF